MFLLKDYHIFVVSEIKFRLEIQKGETMSQRFRKIQYTDS